MIRKGKTNKKPLVQITCEGKIRFTSRRAAQTALNRCLQYSDYTARDRPAMTVYPCGWCAGFHLGGHDLERTKAEADAKAPRHKRFRCTDPDAYSDDQP